MSVLAVESDLMNRMPVSKPENHSQLLSLDSLIEERRNRGLDAEQKKRKAELRDLPSDVLAKQEFEGPIRELREKIDKVQEVDGNYPEIRRTIFAYQQLTAARNRIF